MAGPKPVTSSALRLAISAAILVVLTAPSSAAHVARNVLLSGETLVAGGRLAHGDHSFVLGGDCNLALDDGVWQSGTAGQGSGCRLTLEGDGRLILRSEGGTAVWASLEPPAGRGQYVAAVEPQGSVAVYGPAVWSAGEPGGRQLLQTLGCLKGGDRDNCLVVGAGELLSSVLLLHRGGHPHRHHKLNCLNGGKWDNCIINGAASAVVNVLFSGQVLLNGDCGGATRCSFLRLDDRGGLDVVDDDHRVTWSSNVRSTQGEYVAVLRRDGKVAVYGPAIWSTAGGPAGHHQEVLTSVNRKMGGVKMVTDRE